MGGPGHVDADRVCRALAALALVAEAVAPGTAEGLEGATPYGPESEVPAGELAPLRAAATAAARRALETTDNEWAVLWQEADALEQAGAEVQVCLGALAP